MRCSSRIKALVLVGSAAALLLAAGPTSAAMGRPSASATNDSLARAGLTSGDQVVTEVRVRWRQPRVDCSIVANSRSSIQVALGRPTYHDAEAIGTEADCVDGSPVYFVWAKIIGRPRETSGEIVPGYNIEAVVRFDGHSPVAGYTVRCPDGSYCGGASWSGPASDGFTTGAITVHSGRTKTGFAPLSDFGTVYFTKALMNDAPVGSTDPTVWRMVGSQGTVLAVTSGVHANGHFAINWRAAS